MLGITVGAAQGLGDKLQSFPRWGLYLVLILATAIPLLKPVEVPNKPSDEAVDFYASLMALPDNSRVLIASDWTGSTRGESGGSFQGGLTWVSPWSERRS